MATPWGMVLGCSVLTVNNCFLSTYCVLGRGHPPPPGGGGEAPPVGTAIQRTTSPSRVVSPVRGQGRAGS